MANPTVQVKCATVTFNAVETGYWPLKATAGTYQTGELLGLKADGYAYHFDDSAPMKFLGVFDGIVPKVVASGLSDGFDNISYKKPALLTYPLQTGTASRVTSIGKLAFAYDSGKVQIGSSGLTYGNCVGTIVDVIPSTPNGLTGSYVVVAPEFASVPVVASAWYSAPADFAFFTADRPYKVIAATVHVVAAGSDGSAVTAAIKKVPDATAVASGTAIHSGSIDLKGTANTNQALTLSSTATDLILAPGDSLGLDVTGTTTSATGCIMVSLARW